MRKLFSTLLGLLFAIILKAQVSDTPPYTGADYFTSDGQGLNRTGIVDRFSGYTYSGDVLEEFRKKRGYVDPASVSGMLSNPYHETGTGLSYGYGIPAGFTGHVPVFTEGNWWPNIGPNQPQPPHVNLSADAGLYMINGEVVETVEPVLVQGSGGGVIVNKTPYGILITAGSYPGNEQPGQVMTPIPAGGSAPLPIPPKEWYLQNDGNPRVPELYVSVAGLNPLMAPGWHHSSYSSVYGGSGIDYGTPGFAYLFSALYDELNQGAGNYFLWGGFHKNEGYDPIVSGDPEYGCAVYINGVLSGVMDLYLTNTTTAQMDMWALAQYNPSVNAQGGLSAYPNVAEGGELRYELITHEEAQSLIAAQGGPSLSATYVGSATNIAPAVVPPVIPGEDTGSGSPSCSDGIQNGDETGVDCGGSCQACATTDNDIEAESGSLLGSASYYSDAGASGGQGVAYISAQGAGFSLSNVPAADNVEVLYASEQSGAISVFINGQDVGNLNFSSTGSWVGSYQSASINVAVAAGSTFEMIFQNGDAALNVDYVTFNGTSSGDQGPCTGSDIPQVTVTKTDESGAGANDGTITFAFTDDASNGGTRTNLEFSLDGGSTYPYNVPDNTGSTTVTGLSPDTYDLWVRWGNDECPQGLGTITINEGSSSGSCTGSDIPQVTVTKTDESGAGANDGTITFAFTDDASNGGTRTNLEFSLDGGSTYPYNVPDNTGSTTVTGLSPDTYDLWVRWGNDECPQDLGTITINEATSGGVNYINGKFTPSSGRLLVIGQDYGSITNYNSAIGITPAGHTSYSSVNNLEGINTPADYGTGTHHAAALASDYPQSAIAIGLYLVGQLSGINNGTYDGNINTLIDNLVALDRPVYLRFGYEFDGPWNTYDPTAFRNAWIRFYQAIQARGAQDHIAMVWQSACYCSGTYNGYALDSWYPGDQYVDLVGLSIFTPQDCNYSAVDQVTQFARNRSKPVMICESSPQGYDLSENTVAPVQGGSVGVKTSVSANQIWNDWFQPYFDYIESNKDIIRVVAYINADWDTQDVWDAPYENGYWGDSRVESNATIETNWRNEISGTDWVMASGSLFSAIGYNGGSASGPTCSDGIQNGDETGIDCGGSCQACPTTPTCSDGIQNGDETGVDCGGSCSPCGGSSPDLCGEFGVSYVNDNTIMVYHQDLGWSGSWNYICLDGYCITGSLEDGHYYQTFSATLGQVYSIEFKVQDNATGQYLSGVETVEFTTDQCGFVESSLARQSGSSLGHENSSQLEVYPNPVSDMLQVSGVPDDFTYQLYSIQGAKVLHGAGLIVEVQDLPDGVYILRSQYGQQKVIKRANP